MHCATVRDRNSQAACQHEEAHRCWCAQHSLAAAAKTSGLTDSAAALVEMSGKCEPGKNMPPYSSSLQSHSLRSPEDSDCSHWGCRRCWRSEQCNPRHRFRKRMRSSLVGDLRPSDASRWPLTRGSIGSRGGATGAVPFRRRYVRYCTVPPTAPLAPKTRRL